MCTASLVSVESAGEVNCFGGTTSTEHRHHAEARHKALKRALVSRFSALTVPDVVTFTTLRLAQLLADLDCPDIGTATAAARWLASSLLADPSLG